MPGINILHIPRPHIVPAQEECDKSFSLCITGNHFVKLADNSCQIAFNRGPCTEACLQISHKQSCRNPLPRNVCYTPDELLFIQTDKIEIITADTLMRKIGCGYIIEFTFRKSQWNEHVLNFACQLDISLEPFPMNTFPEELFILQTD